MPRELWQAALTDQRRPDTPTGGKIAVGVGIMLLIALAHIFRVGIYLQAPLSTLYSSYFSDIALPSQQDNHAGRLYRFPACL